MQDVDIAKAVKRPTGNMSSYDLYLRSLPLFRLSRKTEVLSAIDLLDQAIALDPEFAVAMSQSCVCHRQVVDHGWSDNPNRCVAAAWSWRNVRSGSPVKTPGCWPRLRSACRDSRDAWIAPSC